MTTPLVQCDGCARAWNSPTMANGLRLVGSCPRCGGNLVFADAAAQPILAESTVPPSAEAGPDAGVAPHLVLGIPRR